MPVTCKEDKRHLMAQVAGELDHHGARAVMEELDRRIDQAQPRELTLDLSGLTAELLETMNVSGLSQLEGATVGDALKWAVKSVPLSSTSDYAVLSQMVSIYVDMLSDQAFTKEGNTYVAKSVLEDTVNVTVTLTEQGEDIVALDLVMTAAMEEDGMSMTMTMTEHAAPNEVNMDMGMEMTYEGLGVKFHMDLSSLPTVKTPETVPPAGAQIIPMN